MRQHRGGEALLCVPVSGLHLISGNPAPQQRFGPYSVAGDGVSGCGHFVEDSLSLITEKKVILDCLIGMIRVPLYEVYRV